MNESYYHVVAATKSRVLGRELVQKTVYSLEEINDETCSSYAQPIQAFESGLKNWSKLSADLSEEELRDLEHAKAALENYKNVYEIFEYSSELN